MADSKISALQDGGLPTAGDKFPIARGGENFSIDGANIVNAAQIAGVVSAVNGVAARADSAYAQATAAAALGPRLNAAYMQANAAYGLAQQAYNQANVATNQASSAATNAQAAAGSAGTALTRANTADADAFSAWATANAALAQSSNSGAALALAQAAYNQANTATTAAGQANTLAQSAQSQAASAAGVATSASQTANAAYTQVGAAYNQANAAYALAQQAYNRASATAGSVSGVNGVPRLSNYIIAQTDFDDLIATVTPGSGTAGIVTSSRGYWAKAVGQSGTKATTDLTGANGGTNVLSAIPNTFFNAVQIALGPGNSSQALVGVVNYAGGTSSSTYPTGSVGMTQGVAVVKLFQPGMLHSLRGSLSLYAASAAAIQGRVLIGFNTYTNNNVLESGVWFETTVNDTNWFLVYTTGSTTNSGGATMNQTRVDTGVRATYNAGAQFTRFRLDWDGTTNVLNAVINDAQVAQISASALPTNCPYAQGIAGSDCRVNQNLTSRGSGQGTTTCTLVDSLEFVAYYPNARVGW